MSMKTLLVASLFLQGCLLALSSTYSRVTLFIKHQTESAEELRAVLKLVSDPESPQYGKYLSLDEIHQTYQRPIPIHLESVSKHLAKLGANEVWRSSTGDKIISRVSLSGDDLHAALAPISNSLDFYSTEDERQVFRKNKEKKRKVNSRSISRDSIDPQSCLADRVIPPCLRKAYGLGNTTCTSPKSSQAVIVNQGFKQEDLKAFCEEYGLPIQSVVHEVGKNSDTAGDEASLDIQYITTTGLGCPTWWVYINGHSSNPFSNWLVWASNNSEIPHVHSLSVGEPEDEFASDIGGEAAVYRVDSEIAALGARGISVIFASGDSGYSPSQKFGSSSPFVTSVGGVYNGELGYDKLQVDPITTGGFSSLHVHEIQWWQKDAVAAWEKTKGARPSNFNSSRRACPDLSIYDAQYYTVQDGSDTVIGGTSAATPTFAGMISLINDARLMRGLPTLGFLNPFLYKNEDAFLDIVRGGNNGFDATQGYDPASGLGTFGVDTFDLLKLAALKKNNYSSINDSPRRLLLGLKHMKRSLQDLRSVFWKVAGQDGSFIERSKIAEIVEVPHSQVERAKDWLISIGATNMEVVGGDSIQADWPAGKNEVVAPSPPDFADFVVLIWDKQQSRINSRVNERPNNHGKRFLDSTFGPTPQKKAYEVPLNLRGNQSSNVQMVFGTGTFGYRKSDLDLFFSTYSPSSSSKDISFDEANVWKGQTGKNFVEGELDASYISAMAPGVKTLVVNPNTSAATESGEAFGASLLAFLVELNSRAEVPNVLSMSLGSLSFGACNKVCNALASKGSHSYEDCWNYLQTQFQACMFPSQEVEDRIDVEMMKLGLRGTTIVAASGDGASHFAFGPFQGGIGDQLNEIICSSMQMPVYPASSPFVLSVGGIQWSSDDIYGPTCTAESPCGWTDGGGGFSWKAEMPEYQKNATRVYIKLSESIAPKTVPKASSFNESGRAYPDVAALAQFGIPLCTYGGCSGSGGTSASAPTVAGMLSLINDARLNKGKSTLGFLNQRLWQLMEDPEIYGECFRDVGIEKVGDEWDCQTFSTCDGCDTNRGFVATKGWDAQTGFGQPRFSGWMKHLG